MESVNGFVHVVEQALGKQLKQPQKRLMGSNVVVRLQCQQGCRPSLDPS